MKGWSTDGSRTDRSTRQEWARPEMTFRFGGLGISLHYDLVLIAAATTL